MTAPHVLIVTSSAADPAVVVPVLAACEAAGMRVRAIDLGAVGGGGGLPDRFRRALLGESAERRLRKEIDSNPPDVAIAFDPLATAALTLARDAVTNPAPVIGVVGEQPRLEPGAQFQYTSGCVLKTPIGTMHGTYQMVRDDGGGFDAEIAAFSLVAPTRSTAVMN